MSLEQKLVLIGLGLIALHILDDTFLQPEPGNSAGDHLVAGLVPLAFLGVVAATYSRLRRGGSTTACRAATCAGR